MFGVGSNKSLVSFKPLNESKINESKTEDDNSILFEASAIESESNVVRTRSSVEVLLKHFESNEPKQNVLKILDSIKSDDYIDFVDAIYNKKFGTRPEVLKLLAEHLGTMNFTDMYTQTIIAKAIAEGVFGKNIDVLKALAKSLGTMNFTEIYAQVTIATAFKLEVFGENIEVLKALAESLGKMNFTESYAQITIAKAIAEGLFGKNIDVLKALAKSLGMMNFTESYAQITIAKAIAEGLFGKNIDVLKALAKSLGMMNFTESYAQITIAIAVFNQVIGNDLEVLKLIIKSLGTMNITESKAHFIILLAIYRGAFDDKFNVSKILGIHDITDDNCEVLMALLRPNQELHPDSEIPKLLAETLCKMNIVNNEMIELIIAESIYIGAFGNNADVFKLLANNYGKNVYLPVVISICDKKFGDNKNVLKSLIGVLVEANITNDIIHMFFARAIKNKSFGEEIEVLEAVAKSLNQINITNDIAQRDIADAIKDGKLGNLTNAMIKSIISKWIILNINTARYVYGNTGLNYSQLNQQFGIFRKFDDNYLRIIYVADKEINTEYCFSGQGAGSFGVIYNLDGRADLLIVYSEDITDDNSFEDIENEFINFGKEQFSYKNNFSKINVYSLNHSNSHNFPVKLDNLSLSSDKFIEFPRWLQNAILAQNFDHSEYLCSDIIKFVLDFIDSLPFAKDILGQKCRDIIIKIIQTQGGHLTLSDDLAKIKSIKDNINEAFNVNGDGVFNEYKLKVDSFWNKLLTVDDKLKLLYLLGQIAKAGSLGYHIKLDGIEYNLANETFYNLTIYCTQKLIEDYPNALPNYIETLRDNLLIGKCIEQETFSLLQHNPSIRFVWQLK